MCVCVGGTWWLSWLRHWARSCKVTHSIPDHVIGIFHWHNPSGCTVALGLTQPLTEMSTRNISCGVKALWCDAFSSSNPAVCLQHCCCGNKFPHSSVCITDKLVGIILSDVWIHSSCHVDNSELLTGFIPHAMLTLASCWQDSFLVPCWC
jgi:hypothetical protein